jgi:Xaa-Pro aminopeptidase
MKRIKEYLEKVEENSISIFFSGNEIPQSADAKYKFCVEKNFLFFTNINRPDAILMLINDSGKPVEKLFIERNTELKEKWEGARMSKEEASKLSNIPLENIYFTDEFESDLHSTKTRSHKKITDYHFYFGQQEDLRLNKFVTEFKAKYLDVNIKNSEYLVTSLRMLKNEDEVKLIKEALKITKDGIANLMIHSKFCENESHLEAFYHFTLVKNQVKESFTTIAASGVNATVLHYHDNNSPLNKEDLILFDLGVEYKEYCSDISRTFPVGGKFSETQKKYYELVLKANKETIKIIKPGITWDELNKISRDILAKGLIELELIKDESELSKYYFHGIGHHLGLDVHDTAHYQSPLEVGSVITIEPGLYIKELGIGIRIEDDILITETGYENLSSDIIKEVEEIETFMNTKKK